MGGMEFPSRDHDMEQTARACDDRRVPGSACREDPLHAPVPPANASDPPKPVFLNKSLSLAVIGSLQMAMPLVLPPSLLCVVAWAYGAPFDNHLAALAIFTAVLGCTVLRLAPASGGRLARFQMVREVASLAARWALVLIIIAVSGYITDFHSHYPPAVLGSWAVLTPVCLLAVHWLMDDGFRRIIQSQEVVRSSVIVGGNDPGRALANRIQEHPELGFRVVGFFDDRSRERLGSLEGFELIGGLKDVSQYVFSHGIDVIFVALPMRHVERVMEMLDELRDTTVSIYYVPDFFVRDLIQSGTGDVMGVPVVSLCETPFCGYRGILKRATDVVLTIGILVPALPLMGVIALLIRLTSKGPALFKQQRYGLDGEPISVYKFRSMYVTEDGDRVQQATREDPRVTPVGRVLRKTSLDELPQLLNVLQGRMSLVGPRPHAVAHNEQYRGQIQDYMIRHKALPGITGLAQINGCRGETSDLADMEARVHYDLEYLKSWTPLLDLKILFWTAIQVIKGKEAY